MLAELYIWFYVRYMLKALDMYWHEDCLKCGCCDCRLGEAGSTLYIRANLMLCRRDYLRWWIFLHHTSKPMRRISCGSIINFPRVGRTPINNRHNPIISAEGGHSSYSYRSAGVRLATAHFWFLKEGSRICSSRTALAAGFFPYFWYCDSSYRPARLRLADYSPLSKKDSLSFGHIRKKPLISFCSIERVCVRRVSSLLFTLESILLKSSMA